MQMLISKKAIEMVTRLVETDIENNLGAADASTVLALSILIHAQETSRGLAKLREAIVKVNKAREVS